MDSYRRTASATGVLAVALGTALLMPSAALATLSTAPAAAPVVTVASPQFIGPQATYAQLSVTEQEPVEAPAAPVEAVAPVQPPAAPVEAAPVADTTPAEAAATTVSTTAVAPVARLVTRTASTTTRKPLLGKRVLTAVTGSRRTATAAPAPVQAPSTTVARPAAVLGGNPLAGQRLYVASSTSAGREADRVRATDPARAQGLDFIASQPTGYWWGDWNPTSSVRAEVSRHITTATANGSVPVYVVYNIMKRDGSGYSAGGAASLTAYKAWVDEFVAGLGSKPAAVIVEPDAINDLYNMTGTTRTERAAALRYTLTTLKAAGVPAYLDAGGPSIHAPSIVSKLLQEAGIDQATGFAVNVSNFQSTSDNIAWGTAVSGLVGGKHFVIDTGRNGRGSLTYAQDPQYWCNPPGRALGRTPTANTGNPLVDAFLWIKQPGESDGECRGFGPAGQFSADYAYGLYSRM